jgi:glucose-1-phosphate thymidylyltransferase
VILEGAKINGVHHRIADSVIGQRANLTVVPQCPKALRFLIGDDCQIELV